MMLEQVISNLIIKHACVIVPDFGGFISQRVPATLDYKSGKILPPSKSILFNKQLFISDGLLIGAYAAANQLNYDLALLEIKQCVNSWKNSLSGGNRVMIEHIGYLYLNNDGQVCFEQDKFVNLLLSSYGLTNISITSNKEVKEETAVIEFIDFNTVQEIEVSPETKVLEVNFTPKNKLHWTRYVAAAALLPIVFYSFWIPVKTDFLQSGIVSIHDFNPFKKQTTTEFQPTNVLRQKEHTLELKNVKQQVQESNAEQVYSYEVDGNNYKSIVVEKNKISSSTNVIDSKQDEVVEQSSSDSFFLIGNCFGIEENAKKFVNDLREKGLNAQIVDQVNGLYRVSVGSASSNEKLEHVKQEVQAKGISNFWILKK